MVRIRVSDQLPTEQLRKRVTAKVISTLVLSCLATWLMYDYWPFYLPTLNSPSDKIVFTIRCNVPAMVTILILIGYIGIVRYNSEQIDPLSSKDKHLVEVPQRILQNTLEQFLLNFSFQLAASTWMSQPQIRLIPIVVFWFVLGRILFWIGYNNPDYGRTNRSYGFSLSMQPSAVLALFCVSKILSSAME